MPNDTVADQVGMLSQYRLLDASQLEEVRALQGRFADARGLFRELVQRGWLTSWQAGQLVQGKGADLVLGPYILLNLQGEGGAGQVFKARHTGIDRVCALKVVRKDLTTDPEIVGRFRREIELASHINHPNIVHAFDAGAIGAALVLAMEFVDGVDLDRLVKERGPLPVPAACDFIYQASLGLQHAHEQGLIHRDIKPSNLLATQRGLAQSTTCYGIVKILDFGLARLQEPGRSSTRNLTLLAGSAVMQGTPDYMAPEQAIDFHSADTRADIYSLGCTMYFLLAGHPPFPGGSLPEKLLKHQTQAPPPIESIRKDVPPAVAAAVARMLAKRVPDRFQTPAEVAKLLLPLVPVRKDKQEPATSVSAALNAVRPPASGNPVARRSQLIVPKKNATTVKLATYQQKQRQIWRAVVGGGTLAFVLFAALFAWMVTRPAELTGSFRADTNPRGLRTFDTTIKSESKPQAKTSPGRDFDGKKDFIEVAHQPELDPPLLTLSVWTFLTEFPKDRQWVVNKNRHEHTEGYYALLIKGQKVGAYLNIGGKPEDANETWSNADVLKLNVWQHLALTYNGVALTIYCDGKDVGLKAVGKPRPQAQAHALAIGRRQDGFGSSYFKGKLDDIRVYNRDLQLKDIQELHRLPETPPGQPGLVYQKKF